MIPDQDETTKREVADYMLAHSGCTREEIGRIFGKPGLRVMDAAAEIAASRYTRTQTPRRSAA